MFTTATFQFDLGERFLAALLDECGNVRRPSQNLKMKTVRLLERQLDAKKTKISNLRRPTKSESDSTDNRRFTGTIGSNNHVQMRSRSKFDVVIRDKILKFHSDDRTCNIANLSRSHRSVYRE